MKQNYLCVREDSDWTGPKSFLQSILTGLDNENITADLRWCLQDLNVADEFWLKKLNTACSTEIEHQQKLRALGQLRSWQRNAMLSVLNEGETKDLTTGKEHKLPKPNTLAIQVEENKEAIQQLAATCACNMLPDPARYTISLSFKPHLFFHSLCNKPCPSTK